MLWNIFKKKAKQLLKHETADTSVIQGKATLDKHINIPTSYLERLIPIAQLLTEAEIQNLAITAANFAPGTIVFNRGTEIDSLIYLIKGNVFMEADNGGELEINANTFKALYPLSAGRHHYFTAIAGSDVTVIYITKTALEPDKPVFTFANKTLKTTEALKNNQFFNRFRQHFNEDELKIPNFPDIALKLRRAIHQDCKISDIVKIVNLDPVISAKLIQVVNSPIYRPVTPISNCFDAITRLGLTTTRNLVTAFSMKHMTKSGNPLIQKLMQYHWTQSIKISSISYTLAQLTYHIDPDEALLAGLLHNIGVLPILTFAETLPVNAYHQADLELCINELQGQLGSIILEKWEFPDNLKQIPLQSTNWFANSSDRINLNDIVLLAKYHNLLTTPDKARLPLLTTLPAFHKLDNQLLTPEMSLQILHDAKQQIADTMKFFSH
ncbi:MAG: HDOD domain-containing protein [Methylobacter sp.]